MKQVPYTRKKCAGIELILMQPRWRIYISWPLPVPCWIDRIHQIFVFTFHETTLVYKSSFCHHDYGPVWSEIPYKSTLFSTTIHSFNSKLCTPRPKKCINCLFQLLAPLPPTFRPLPLTLFFDNASAQLIHRHTTQRPPLLP